MLTVKRIFLHTLVHPSRNFFSVCSRSCESYSTLKGHKNSESLKKGNRKQKQTNKQIKNAGKFVIYKKCRWS